LDLADFSLDSFLPLTRSQRSSESKPAVVAGAGAEEFVVGSGSLNLTVEWNGMWRGCVFLRWWWGLRRLSEEEEASLPGLL
jgi:hypothetical protein